MSGHAARVLTTLAILISLLAAASGFVSTSDAMATPSVTFNVMDYGAVHDNSTDDVPAIKRAVAAAVAAGGGTVYLPAGTYLLYANEPIDHPSNSMQVNLLLRDHVTFKGDGIGKTILSNTGPSYTSTLGSTGGTDLHVADMTLTTPLGTHLGDGDGIKLQDCTNSTFTNVYAENYYTDFMIYGCRNVTLTGCIARGRKVLRGTHTEWADCMNFVIDSFSPTTFGHTNGVTLTNCASYESDQCGFWAYAGGGRGSDLFRVRNVTFKNCYAHDNDGAGFYTKWSYRVTYAGCRSNTNGWGFYLVHAKDYLVSRCTAQRNHKSQFRYVSSTARRR